MTAETDTSTHQAASAEAQIGASIADPAPLGLAAFAATTFVLSVFNAGILSDKLEPAVLPLALFYGGVVQLLAGMWEFRRGNTFGALAFSSYGGFWLAFAAYVKLIVDSLGPDKGSATGLFLLAFVIFTGYMIVPALRTNVAVLLVFILLTLTFLVLSIASFSGVEIIGYLGGYVGLITALVAWYASFAGVTNSMWGRSVIPVGPLS